MKNDKLSQQLTRQGQQATLVLHYAGKGKYIEHLEENKHLEVG